MELDWIETTWGDIAELKYGKSLKGYKEAKGKYPVFGTNGPVGECDQALCDHEGVIIGRKGAYRGVHYSSKPFFVIDTAFFLKPLCEINLKWAYYQLKTQDINGLDSGSAIPSTRREDFYALPLKLPPIKTQNAIADYLSTIEDKIELNRQTNETLEQMAQALFKSWFVDFDPVIDNALDAGNQIPEELEAKAEQRKQLREAVAKGEVAAPALPDDIRSLFPSEFEFTEEMGWIPRGWVVSTTHDEFDIKGGSTPSTKNPDFWEGGDINWTSPKDLSGNVSKILLDTDRKITLDGLVKITSGLLPVDTVLMSSRAPVGYLALAKIPVAINQGYIALVCNKRITPEYSIQLLDSIMDEIKGISGGTTFAEISKKTFRAINVLVPDEALINAYTDHVREIYNRITEGLTENQALEKTRDTLLPKLISGELQIPEAEQQIAEALN